MKHRSSALLACALALALASSRSAVGQDEKRPPLTFGAEISIVAVPVFVTDKDGNSVAGLTAQDFVVEDAGKTSPVEGFLAITGGPVQAPSGASGPGAGAAQLSSRRQFILLFDLALSRAVIIERSRAAARRFVEAEVKPGDLVAVVAATPQGMKSLLGLSPDRGQVLRAIGAIGRGDVARNRDPLGLLFDASAETGLVVSSDADGREAIAADDSRAIALMLMRQQRQAYAAQISQFLGGLQGMARQLDSIRGRKNVILFSEGFDTTIISGAQGNEKGQASEASIRGALWEVDSDTYFGSATGQDALSGVFQAMRGSDVVIHSIDLGSAGTDTMDLSSQEGSPFNPVSGLDALATFATNTGGRFIKGVTDIDSALVDISNATKSYYVVAFSPRSSDAGKPRKLKISVRPPGLKVSHRPTYVLPDPKKPDVNRQVLQASEIIAKGVSGGSIVLSAYALPYLSPQNGIGVPVVIQIPPAAFTESLKGKKIDLELFGYLVDDQGTVSDFFKATPTLDPVALGPKLKADGLQILTTFGAAPGNYEVRLLLRDPASQKFGALRLPVVIPDFANAAFVSSPMVTGDPFARVALPTVTQRRPNREIPFRVDERPFTVEADPVLKKGSAHEICVFKSPSSGTADPLQVILIGADGIEKAQKAEGLKVVRDADGFDRVVFSVSPKDVTAGAYLMKVVVGSTTSVGTPMWIQ